MAKPGVNELVANWFKGEQESDYESLTMSDASDGLPELVWESILEILKHKLTDDQRALLAAGPLENLLVKHGPAFIERIEKEAKTNSTLNDLLGGVWRRDIARRNLAANSESSRRGVVILFIPRHPPHLKREPRFQTHTSIP